MPEPPADRLLRRAPRLPGTSKEAAEAGEVFLVLAAEHADCPLGRHEAEEAAVAVEHGETA